MRREGIHEMSVPPSTNCLDLIDPFLCLTQRWGMYQICIYLAKTYRQSPLVMVES